MARKITTLAAIAASQTKAKTKATKEVIETQPVDVEVNGATATLNGIIRHNTVQVAGLDPMLAEAKTIMGHAHAFLSLLMNRDLSLSASNGTMASLSDAKGRLMAHLPSAPADAAKALRAAAKVYGDWILAQPGAQPGQAHSMSVRHHLKARASGLVLAEDFESVARSADAGKVVAGAVAAGQAQAAAIAAQEAEAKARRDAATQRLAAAREARAAAKAEQEAKPMRAVAMAGIQTSFFSTAA